MRWNVVQSIVKFILISALISNWSSPCMAQSVLNPKNGDSDSAAKNLITLTIGTKTISATLANTDSSRTRGLLGWNTIRDDQGMLLDFVRPGMFAIHMQGMKFPIDALWIDSNGVIKLIYPAIQPDSGLTYPSMFPVRYCLEVRSGFCGKHGIKEGQKVVFGH